jgi:Na+-transporting NADH:ubiquinone oxidoreductase subunit NqrE
MLFIIYKECIHCYVIVRQFIHSVVKFSFLDIITFIVIIEFFNSIIQGKFAMSPGQYTSLRIIIIIILIIINNLC